jgi:hypothetical protein
MAIPTYMTTNCFGFIRVYIAREGWSCDPIVDLEEI